MTIKYHQGLTLERWRALSWDRRLLNIASELMRLKNRIQEGDETLANQAIERALELTDLSVESWPDGKSSSFLHEFLRFREVLAGFYVSKEKDFQEFMILFRVFLDLDPVVHNLGLEI